MTQEGATIVLGSMAPAVSLGEPIRCAIRLIGEPNNAMRDDSGTPGAAHG